MTDRPEQDDTKRSVATEDGLSLAWVMAGVVLFATALGAPVAVFHLQGSQTQTLADASPASLGKATSTTSREARSLGTDGEQDQALASLLGDGAIVPGVGIGPVVLDTEVQDLLGAVREPSRLSYAFTDTGLQGLHDVYGPDFKLTITAERDLGQINSVALSALDCTGLRTFQPRQNGLPETAEGLSLGSHVSRVRTTLGAPNAQSPVSGRQGRVEHSYPGLRLSYCAQDMVIGGIKIERLPPAPLIAAPTVPEPARQPTTLSDNAIVSLTPDLDAAQLAPVISEIGSGALPSSTLPLPEENPIQLAHAAELQEPVGDAPTPLLALSGAAFTAGDAFSLSRDKRQSGIIDRAAAPSTMFLAAARANMAEDVDVEFDGVAEFLVAKAEESETALNLSHSKRGAIQRRLQLIGYDPKGVDGIFGPRTREVISEFQVVSGLPATGFLDASVVAALEDRSAGAFDDWQERQRVARAERRLAAARRAAEERARTEIVVARVPAPRNAPGCARDNQGIIISNQSFSCDVSVLEESLSYLFSGRRS